MSEFEFLTKSFEYLAWPLFFLLVLPFFYRPILSLLARVDSGKVGPVEFTAPIPKAIIDNRTTDEKSVKSSLSNIVSQHQGPNFRWRLYSNGLMVQELEFLVPKNQTVRQIVFPISMVHEAMSCQLVGDAEWKLTQLGVSNCEFSFRPSSEDRTLKLVVTGL